MDNFFELKKIWKNIFKDTDEYIELFFSRKVKPENIYTVLKDNRIASVLFAVPEKINGYRAAYICGVATLPEYRGMGLCKSLMKEAEEDLKKRGFDICFLIPADESLFNFYEVMGYKTRFWLSKKELVYQKNDVTNCFSAEYDYLSLKKFYSQIRCVNKPYRDDDNFKAIYDCYKNVRIYKNGYLFWYKEGEVLKIIEHTLDNIEECVSGLLKDTGFKKAEIISPCGENPYPFAMMKILNKKISENEFSDIYNNYVNLMLN